MDVTEAISKCIQENRLIEFTYHKKNGGIGQYIVEPYEIKGAYLFAFDPRVPDKQGTPIGGIKQFSIAGIENHLVLEKRFSRRFTKPEEKDVKG